MLNINCNKQDKNISYLCKQNNPLFAWTPLSWENFKALQQPIYENKIKLEMCLSQIRKSPILVCYSEIELFKKHIILASKGQEFLLQAGDCAELFKDCKPEIVEKKINIILQLKQILETGLKKSVIPIGRIAGQYAKPRSNEYETRNALTLSSFKGDIINSSEFTYEARQVNPEHMLTAYDKASKTLNYIKNHLGNSSFYVSHEALLLCYESALIRYEAEVNRYYNASAHFLWLGERTRNLEGAHIEYLRGVSNPVGIKLSSKITNKELIELISTLNPLQEEGKIVLIPRLGAGHTLSHLPRLIRAVKAAKLNVTWMCDPMHGNGELSSVGIKTRRFENIAAELFCSVKIHAQEGTHLAGMHIENAEENVAECLGGKQIVTEADLQKNFRSACDPRLNPSQAHELSYGLIKELTRDPSK